MNGAFKDAEQIAIGEHLFTHQEKYVEVVALNYLPSKEKVYNFEVEENHCYFVGSDGILVLNACSLKNFYSGMVKMAASEMKIIKRGTKEWADAVKKAKESLVKGEKFQAKVEKSSDAKKFLNDVHGNMDRRKAHTQSKRADGVPKYKKGYEQHQMPEKGMMDKPHIKWYNNETDGHIFYDIPN